MSYTLAFGTAEKDLGFTELAAVARELVRRRDAKPGRPFFRLRLAHVWRGAEGGAAVSVRVHDGADAGHGSLIAYVFMPGDARAPRILMDALEAAQPRAEAA